MFSVHCCNNFFTGYNFDNIFAMKTQETQNAIDQSWHSNTERNHY